MFNRIDFPALFESLIIMGKGMLGIFIVTCIIVGSVLLLNALSNTKSDR